MHFLKHTTIPIFFLSTLFTFSLVYAKEISINGVLKEKGNGKLIPYATIVNSEHREQFFNSDEEGHFHIKIDDSVKTLLFRADNYYDKSVDLSSLSKSDENKIYLEILPDIVGSGIIRAKRKQEISQTNLNQEEVRYGAGTGGDIVRSISTLPSVSPASVGSANIVVRGGDPGDNAYYYDDLELPFAFHFGGVNTVIPTKMIDSVDFYPGGYSAQYGDVTGGVIQMNSQNLVPERFSGDIEAGLFQSGIYLEGSILGGEKREGSKNIAQDDNAIGYRIGFRRTYYELYAPIINKSSDMNFYTFPQSTDYQLVLNGKRKNSTWQVYLLGALDKLGILGNIGNSLDSTGQNSFDFSNIYQTTGIKYNLNLGDGLGFQTTLQQLYFTFTTSFANNYISIDQYKYSLKSTLIKNFNANNFIEFGVTPKYEKDVIRLNIFQLQSPGSNSQTFDPFTAPRVKNSQTIDSIYGETFLDLNMKPLDNLLINPGINILKGNQPSQFGADPRLGIRYEFLPKQTIKGAVGYYSERPAPQYSTPEYGNPRLKLEKTLQYVLGYETKLFTDWSLDLQTWHKSSNNLVGPALANPAHIYENSISSRATGFDFYLKKEFIGRFYGWLSYTYSKSEKQDPGSGIWRYSEYDKTHVLSLSANAKVTNKWRIGTLIRYSSGTPYSSISGGIFNQNTGQYVPNSDGNSYLISENDNRFDPFFQMDIRSDYDFLYDTWKLDLYVAVDNITNQKNISRISYNKDYTERLNVYGFPILPSIGVIASF